MIGQLALPEPHLPAVAVGAALLRLRHRRGGDDRAPFDRRGDAVPGAQREAGGRRVDHRSAGGPRRRSHEDRRNRRALFLDRPRIVPVPTAFRVAALRKGDLGGRATDRGKASLRSRGGRQGISRECERRDPVRDESRWRRPGDNRGEVGERRWRPALDRSDNGGASTRDRPLSCSFRQRRGSRYLGRVALLQRVVAEWKAVGIRLVHRWRRCHRHKVGRQAGHNAA